MAGILLVFQLLQSSDGGLHCDCRGGIVGPGPARHCFHAGTTVPDANGSSLHLGLATEGASVLGVMADFNFLHHFPEGGTIAGPVFADDPDLLGAFRLCGQRRRTDQRHLATGSQSVHANTPLGTNSAEV